MFINHHRSRKIPQTLCYALLGMTIFPNLVSAQISADNTLGLENSIIIPNVTINKILSDRVDGGAMRGSNLFHSFSELNVSEGRGVYFSNPTGITNIINRVTGSNSSSILGKLGVLGNANLFLVNPNGIIFGPQTSLDLGGSFVATTANAIQFGEQGSFSASNPEAPPLLTVNPSAFIFNRLRANPINLNSSKKLAGQRIDVYSETGLSDTFGLQVPDGKSLILLGGDVTLTDSHLNALGGRTEIGSVAGTGTVGLTVDNNIWSLNFPSNLALGNISLAQGSRVYTSGDRGGSIQITGNNIRLTEGSLLAAETFGTQSGDKVILNATDTIEIIETPPPDAKATNIVTSNYGEGNGGDIIIKTGKLLLKEGAQAVTLSQGVGVGGTITVDASESVELSGRSVRSNNFTSSLVSVAVSTGRAGNININTKDLILKNGGLITTQSVGEPLNEIGNQTFAAQGDAGNIHINASNSVLIDSTSVVNPLYFSSIVSATTGVGNAGNITINTGTLTIQNGGAITVSSEGEGTMSGSNQAKVTVSSTKGQAGNLNIYAHNVFIDRGFLTAETAQSGVNGANINLQLSNLLKMQNESLISAQATGGANGGNVTINSPLLAVLLPTGTNGSDIIAKAEAGNGGNILINSQGIFGTAEGKAVVGNRSNNIDASSEFGAPGRVLINNTIDPNQGTVTLPEDVVDPNTLVAQNACKRGTASQLTQTGRGGLPPTISENLNSQAIAVGLIDPAPSSVSQAENQVIASQDSSITQNQIAPAQGWIFNQKGEVMLVAYDPTVTGSQRVKVNPLGCVVP